MKNLTIEHLAKRLPYGLRIKKGERNLLMNMGNGSSTYWIGINSVFKWFNSDMIIKPMPVLFPLSYITKEIHIKGVNDGKPFVPIEMFEIGDGDDNGIEYDYGNIKLIKDLELIAIGNLPNAIHFLPYSVINKFHEYHIDYENLIDDGLAVDVTTLEVNPYK